jgi:hypothetical protein
VLEMGGIFLLTGGESLMRPPGGRTTRDEKGRERGHCGGRHRHSEAGYSLAPMSPSVNLARGVCEGRRGGRVWGRLPLRPKHSASGLAGLKLQPAPKRE